MRALVFIHDVMPETFDRVVELLAWLRLRAVGKITLLVGPGRSWSPREIELLRI